MYMHIHCNQAKLPVTRTMTVKKRLIMKSKLEEKYGPAAKKSEKLERQVHS